MSKKIKVLHIDTGYGWRGGQQQAFYLHSMLEDEFVDSIMLCQPGSEMSRLCKEHGLRYETVKMRGELDFIAVYHIAKIVNKEGIDIVHCHCAHSLSLGVLTKFFLIKLVLIAARRVDFPIKNNIFSRFKYKTNLVNHIVCISQNIKDIMIAAGIDEDKLSLIHSGVDTDKYADLSDAKTPLELQEHINKKTIIGTVAALTGHKDYPTLLKAAYLVLADRDDCVFIALGDGKDKAEIFALKEKLGLEDKFIYAGYKENVGDYLAFFNYFVLASKKEGLGTSVLDAMSAGIPVIACASGGIPEMINHNENGLLVEKKNPQDLALKINYALNHPEEMQSFAEKSKEVVKEFSIRNTIKKNADLYKNFISHERFREEF